MTLEQPVFDPLRPNLIGLARYFRTANERHAIYLRRKAGKSPPWTKDPIFRQNKFCNVYRELDRVTVWIRENWREPYADHPNLPFAMALARLINWPDSLAEIGFPKRWKPKRVYDVLMARKERGEKVFTDAYLLGSIPLGMPRAEYFVHHVLTPLYENPIEIPEGASLRDTWERLWKFKGIGPFLAYEIVTDLRHTKYLCNATDIMVWANPGPGCIRGLCRLYGMPIKGTKRKDHWHVSMPDAKNAMRHLLRLSEQKLGSDMPPWEMRDVEHWLCEYDKYCRVMEGGRGKKFEPNSARGRQGRLF